MGSVGRGELLLGAVVLAAGFAGAGYFVSQTLYNSNVAVNIAEVRGLAERRVTADTAHWQIGYNVTGQDRGALSALYAESQVAQAAIIALLTEHGLNATEITPGVIEYLHNEFRDDQQKLVDERHMLYGSISVETSNVDLVARVRAELNQLVAQGYSIANHPPLYLFTRLNDIKPDMLREATANARIAANEFATDAGVKVGGIRSARQGSFEIRDAGQEHSDSMKIEKTVRVVTSVGFYLTD